MKKTYSVHVGLLWDGVTPSITGGIEIPSDDFDGPEELCQAVASQLLEAIKAGNNYLISINKDVDIMGA
jgi:hypothetical protein